MFYWTENDNDVEVVEHVGGLGTRMGPRFGYENGSDAVVMHQFIGDCKSKSPFLILLRVKRCL